ncbi:hypothetical protein [Methylocystis parvus]|uniref:bestrophin-like domain n=1 Tax=Methylocystis parvus TaxID=134 RepID=UPI003C78B2DC
MLADTPLPFIFFASLILFALASEAGHRLGVFADKEANVATLEASVLGLLALMLSFTFAMAVTRFDARRDALLKEANAIGTAGLRARLLPAPHNAESLNLLRDYVGVRVSLTETTGAQPSLDAAVARANALQESLWREAKSAAAKDNGMVPTGLFIQALNDVFDAQETRLTAYRHRVPRIVFFALYGIAALGVGFSGYASGLERRRWRLPVYLVAVLVASVILLIQDIDRPDSGSVRVSAQPMIDTANALATYAIDAEPPPAPAPKPSEPPRRAPR